MEHLLKLKRTARHIELMPKLEETLIEPKRIVLQVLLASSEEAEQRESK